MQMIHKQKINEWTYIFRLPEQDSTLGECLIYQLNRMTKGASYVRSHPNERYIDLSVFLYVGQDPDELLVTALQNLQTIFKQMISKDFFLRKKKREKEKKTQQQKKIQKRPQKKMDTLQLDDWIYTIGKRAGLYHQRVGSHLPPTRIHNSHPPSHHQERVKQFQEDWAKRHGTVVLSRYGTKDVSKQSSTQSSTHLSKLSLNESQSLKQSSTHKQKISRKSKPNLTDPVVVITPDALTIQNQLHLPTNDREVINNINQLQATEFPIVPAWVQTQLPRVTKSNSRVYYSNDTSLTQVKRYVVERLVCEENSCIVKKSFYDLASSKQLIGIYNKTNVSFNEGKTIYDIHGYIAYEGDQPNDTMSILSRALVCARQLEKHLVLFDLDSSQEEPELLLDTIQVMIEQIASLPIQLTIGIISKYELSVVPSNMLQFENLQDAILKTDILDTLFVSFFHMRFVLNPESMFAHNSSIGIQSYGLTNLELLNEKNYFVG